MAAPHCAAAPTYQLGSLPTDISGTAATNVLYGTTCSILSAQQIHTVEALPSCSQARISSGRTKGGYPIVRPLLLDALVLAGEVPAGAAAGAVGFDAGAVGLDAGAARFDACAAGLAAAAELLLGGVEPPQPATSAASKTVG